VPEKVYGTRFATEPATELLKDAVAPVENPAETFDCARIPRRVLVVLPERGRHRHAEWLFPDRDIDSEILKRLMKTTVELGDRNAAIEIEGLATAVLSAHDQCVIDEVEIDLECCA
jgi:hypothetical protein